MPLQLSRILVASDLTESSDEVLRAAARIAAFEGAELHAVHAAEPSTRLPGGREGVLDMQERIHAARHELAEQLRRTGTEEAVASARIIFDSPHRAINDRAREVGAQVIVLGPHQGGTLGERLLGTTADRVIRTSDVPCLIVRGELSIPLRRVLAPIDFSGPSQLALSEAFAWAAALGEEAEPTEVRVVHVVPAMSDVAFMLNRREWAVTQLDEQVEAARATLPDSAPLRVRKDLLQATASPAEEILHLAEPDVDLVVLGTHGRSALGRALIGSVASAVVSRAHCPVLLIPPVLEVALPGRSIAESGRQQNEQAADILPQPSGAP